MFSRSSRPPKPDDSMPPYIPPPAMPFFPAPPGFQPPPVIPAPDGWGGYMFVGGFNPDSAAMPPFIPPPPMFHAGPSTYTPAYSGPMSSSSTRPSWTQGSAGEGPGSPPRLPWAPPPPYTSPYAIPQPAPPPVPWPPAHNTLEMTREHLLAVLNHFSETLGDYFDLEPLPSEGWTTTTPHRTSPYGSNGEGSSRSKPTTLRMAVHGGACMLLHQGLHALSLDLPLTPPQGVETPVHMSQLCRRTSTRDVDIILRGFLADFGLLGPPPNPGERARRNPSYPGEGQPHDPYPDSPTRVSHLDAEARLKACIRNTARAFPGLGLDWMNADADVALPMTVEPQTKLRLDPLHSSTFTRQNVDLYTVYTSPNKRLTLVSVPPYWSIALKIARWGQRDWADVGILLRNGTLLSGTAWTEEMLIAWLKKNCWAMGYAVMEMRKWEEFKDRVRQAVKLIEGWEPTPPGNHFQVTRPQDWKRERDLRDWGSNEQRRGRGRSKSRAKSRSKSRARSRPRSILATEIFIPPNDEDGDYDELYQDYEPRGRAHNRHHPQSHHNQLMHPPPPTRGPSSGALSQATGVAPFVTHPQIHTAGGSQNTRAWRRQSSKSSKRDHKKARQAKLRDIQRRIEHQRSDDMRSEWNLPTDSESESETEESDSEDDSSEDSNDEEDKENRDRRRAWRQANIYAPPNKQPSPLNVPAVAASPPPVNPLVQQNRQPQPSASTSTAQPQIQTQYGRSSTSPNLPPIEAGAAARAQYQFEQQWGRLEAERRAEERFRETLGRAAVRVLNRINQ